MSEQHAKGVDYYNKDNKDNKDNAFNTDNNCFASLSGRAAIAAQDRDALFVQAIPLKENLSSYIESPTPQEVVPQDFIKMEDVLFAPIQLFDNEGSTQKYKLKIQLNCKNEERYEFIAALTQDRRNFCKYLPEASREWFKDWTDSAAAEMRKFDIKIYRGKFHLNQGFVDGQTRNNQIEDYCACVLWWDKTHYEWRGAVKMYEFETAFRLDKGCISPRQERAGLIAQFQYKSEEYIKSLPERPKTLWQIKNNK